MGKVIHKATGNSGCEDRFIELFCDAIGADKGQYVYLQYPMVDIYGRHRTIDFAVNLPDGKVAIEVDGNTWHQPGIVSTEKYHDDLLKQNSMVFEGWRVYRWTSAQIDKSPDRVKDELVTFLGQSPLFRYIEDALPPQQGETFELMHHSKNLGTLQFYKVLARQLTEDDYTAIRKSCHAALAKYFGTAEA